MSRIVAQVLILADDEPGLSTLELALLERGANVLRVQPESARETLAKFRPDLVLVEPIRIGPSALTLVEACGAALVAMLRGTNLESMRHALAIRAQDLVEVPVQGDGAADAERLLELASGIEELETPRLDVSVERLRRQVQELTDRYVRQCRTNDEAQDVFYLDLSRMMTIFDNIMDGILFTDTDGQVTLMNPVAEKLLGVKTIFAIGKNLRELGMQEEIGRRLVEAHAAALEARDSKDALIELHDADVDRFVALRTTTVLDYRGTCAGVLSVVKDVTSEIVSEQMRNRYLSIVSHELRTPLTGIKSFATMLTKGLLGPLNERQQRVSESMREQTQRLEYEVDKLISLGRIESGELAMDREPLQVDELLSKVTAPFVAVARDRSIDFTIQELPQRVLVLADREDLRRAVRALVENAIKFTPDGGTILIRSALEDEDIAIYVTDNGPGIDPRLQRRIFEKFFQVEDPLTRQFGGAGLGLHVALAVAKAHGGTIDVASKLGHGATFRIRLPRYFVEADINQDRSEDAPPHSGQASSEFSR